MAHRLLEIVPYPIIRMIDWYLQMFLHGYFGVSFLYYEMEPSLQIWGSICYAGHVGTIGACLISAMLPKYRKKVKEGDKTTPISAE